MVIDSALTDFKKLLSKQIQWFMFWMLLLHDRSWRFPSLLVFKISHTGQRTLWRITEAWRSLNSAVSARLTACIYPLHPNFNMRILHTVLHTFLRCWQGEFVQQSRASLVGGHFLNFYDPNVWFRGDIVRRNYTLVSLWGQRVKAQERSNIKWQKL